MIEKDIPLPRERDSVTKFQIPMFDSMAVGDSFLCPKTHANNVKTIVSHVNRVMSMKFTTRRTTDGNMRVWRTA